VAQTITPDMLVGLEDAPAEVKESLRADPREPETDPKLGIPVTVDRVGTPKHRLVTIGDSLTHGFQSGAIFNTKLSYPAIIAREMGWNSHFRYPTYASPGDGLPLNLEKLARELSSRFQVEDGINAIDVAVILPWLRGYLDQSEDFWERGPGANPPEAGAINHNLAVYGWDLRNTLSRKADICKQAIQKDPPRNNFELSKIVPENANDIAALHVLNTARDAAGNSLTPLGAATVFGEEGSQEDGQGDGIETLIIFIGANNVLGSILTFKVKWSGDDFKDMDKNNDYTVWLPSHFKSELDEIVEEVKQIKARHVIWVTVPHVTVAPFAHGINKERNGEKVKSGSRYFPFYAPIWLTEEIFDPDKHKQHLTANEARAIDSVIDKYNEYIVDTVRKGRNQGRDWYVFEAVALLDRLAARRYIDDPTVKIPDWWTPYPLPPAVDALQPKPDTRFFESNLNGRQKGGLFALDGIHPTTIGYGIIAQEIINIMQLAGVKFYQNDGITERTGKVEVDFGQLVKEDTLIFNPPSAVSPILDFIGWLDGLFGIVSQIYKSSI
jgi:hypothetical protein